MHLINLRVHGFRSLRDVEWRPGPLNILIGPNASGKSNLLSLIELLAISARGGLGDFVLRQGGIAPLLFDGKEREIAIALTTSPFLASREPDRDSLTYLFRLTRLGDTSAYRIEEERLNNDYRVETGKSTELFKLLERTPQHAMVLPEKTKELLRLPPPSSEEESFLSIAGDSIGVNKDVFAFHEGLASWAVYHELQTGRDAPVRQAVVTKADKQVQPSGQNLIAVLHTLYTGDREFKRAINAAMNVAFAGQFEELVFPPAADQRVQLRIQWRDLSEARPSSDLSDGTLRFLFLLAILTNPDPPGLIAIDEPETGLHPSMLPVLAEHAAEASRRTQVVLTTHSPEFLDAFRGMTTQPSITVVEMADGETDLRTINGDELAHWLKEYSLGELFRSGELESAE